MAVAVEEHYVNIELSKNQVIRSFAMHRLGEGDDRGDVFGVYVFKNGQPFNVEDCSAQGYFIRPDGNTTVCTGDYCTISGNKVSIRVPEACYAYEGSYTFAIKIIKGTNYAKTVAIFDGVICNVMDGSGIDPGNIMSSLAGYADLAEEMQEYADLIESLTISSQQISGTRYKIIVTKEDNS